MLKITFIILIGAIITIVSIGGISNPKKMINTVLSINPTIRYLIAIIVRLLLGVVLIYSADVSNYSIYIYIIGGLLVLSAFAILYLRPSKLTVLLNWVNEMPNYLNRVWLTISAIIGILLILAAIF